MGDKAPPLRMVARDAGPPPRRRSPGPAVLSVLAYALLFGGALWYWRARSPLASTKVPETSPARAPAAGDAAAPPREHQLAREALLSGEAVVPAARHDYFRHLARDRCDCGCGRTLSDCLANEKSCSRSPQLASKVIQDSKFKIQN